MSFGISIGDFIAVDSLIADICNCLQASGGSKSKYQELQHELDLLKRNLDELDRLPQQVPNATLELLKYSTASCQNRLEDFREKWRKYERSLGVGLQPLKVRGITDKIRWGMEEKDEVRKLQTYLPNYHEMINTHLLQLGIMKIDDGFALLTLQNDRVTEVVKNSHVVVTRIENSVATQGGMLANLAVLVPRMISALTHDVRTSWSSILQLLYHVCDTTEQVYAIVVQLKSNTPQADTRWTFFQEPIVVEDPLGVKFPLPSEYSACQIVRCKCTYISESRQFVGNRA